jgi:hypothetical protein
MKSVDSVEGNNIENVFFIEYLSQSSMRRKIMKYTK